MSTIHRDLPIGGGSHIAAPRQPTPNTVKDDNAERRRAGLRWFLERRGLTAAELSRLVGLSTPNALYNHLHGRSASIGVDTMERIVALFPQETLETLLGYPARPASPGDLTANSVSITHEAAAGIWRRRHGLSHGEQLTIAVPEDFILPVSNCFAVRVRAHGAGRMYPTGTLLICMPIPPDHDPLPAGARVVIRRDLDGKSEVTVCEAVMDHPYAWLWPHSDHPESRLPIRATLPLFGSIPCSCRGILTVLGQVIAVWRPGPEVNTGD